MTRRLIPLAMFAVCVALMGLLHWVWPAGRLLGHPASYAGAVPALVGWVLTLMALYQFRKARTTCAAFHEPGRLVTGGVFRFTRNPIYLGLAMVMAGGCIFLGASCLLVPVLAFVIVADRWIVRGEERALARKFGKAYEDYRSRTPRWV